MVFRLHPPVGWEFVAEAGELEVDVALRKNLLVVGMSDSSQKIQGDYVGHPGAYNCQKAAVAVLGLLEQASFR